MGPGALFGQKFFGVKFTPTPHFAQKRVKKTVLWGGTCDFLGGTCGFFSRNWFFGFRRIFWPKKFLVQIDPRVPFWPLKVKKWPFFQFLGGEHVTFGGEHVTFFPEIDSLGSGASFDLKNFGSNWLPGPILAPKGQKIAIFSVFWGEHVTFRGEHVTFFY